MSCIRSSYPSFYLFLFSIFLFVIFPSATSHSHSSPIPDGVEIVGRRQYDEVLLWKTRSLLAKETSANSSHLLLAENRTRRPDPLDHYNTYTGGWNISSTHYIASVISTAVPFFGIAAVWFMIFGLTLSLLCLCYCCCRRREPFGYSRVAYALSLILLVLFTLAAIAGCIVLYTGQGKFHTSTSDTLGYVVSQAYLTAETLRNVSGYLDAAKHIGVDAVFLPTDVQQKIDDVKMKINSAAVTLSTKTEANSKKIQHGIDQMRMTLIIVAAIMLFLAFLGFLFSILGMQVLVYILVVFGWVLVAVTFVLCGIFLFLHNAVGDACVAMDEWVQNPTAHTALDDILPCVDNATAQEILLRTEDVTYKLVNLVDTAIANVSNREFPPSAGIVYYNQSGPHMPPLCNPFNPDITDRACAAEEVTMENAAEAWKKYVCEISSAGICSSPGRMTPIIYGQMTAAVNVSYALHHYAPFLVGLVDCTFVRKTFTDISSQHCPGLRKYSEWIYIGLVTVSAAVMLSLIFWIIYARERRHRVYTKHLLAENAPYG